MTSPEQLVEEALALGFTLEPDLTVSLWSDQFRILSQRSSAAHGPWRTSRTPFGRDIMDCLSAKPPERLNIPRGWRRIVFMKPTQISGSEIGNNWTGYVIHHAPGPMLQVFSNLENARKSSHDRIGPMIQESPELRARTNLTVKDAGVSTLKKSGPGWSLSLVGSKAASGLKSSPIRYLNGEEIDEWPANLSKQGDPIALAERRLGSFGSRAIAYYNSTPTIRGQSRIEGLYLVSDQRRYFVPCPACKNLDFIRFENIIWENNEPSTARLRCVKCSELIEEHWKTWMLKDAIDGGLAEWRPTAPAGEWDGRTIGFHLNGFYTPAGWSPTWAEIVSEFLEAKKDRSKLTAWTNTRLGETWEERGDGAEPETILARAERYPIDGGVPNGVGYLVAAVDVQGDRLEVIVKGYGAGAESWLIARHVIVGNPERDEVWWELDKWLLEPFAHESGQRVYIGIAVVDSNYLANNVYRFVQPRQKRVICPVFAVRGGNERGKHLVATTSVHKTHRVRIYTLCTDTGKDIVAKRLTIGTPPAGRMPGYMHMPEWITRDYVDQLTAEQKLPRSKRGGGTVYEWTKIRERNEALDLEVYCLAALEIRGGPALLKELPERAAKWAVKVEGEAAAPTRPADQHLPSPAPVARPLRPSGRGWIGRHRPGR